MNIYELNIIEPFFFDIHTRENGYSAASDDILEAVQACPIHTGRDKNEIGEDCEGCALHDPDRADLCIHIQMCRPVAIDPDLNVWFEVGAASFCDGVNLLAVKIAEQGR